MTTTSRSARYAKWLSIPLGLAISALLIWQASYAAFSDDATSRGNTWTSGTVTLTRADDGTALFNPGNVKPGDTATKDVTVTYDGTVDATVKFYGENLVNTELAKYIELEVRGSWGPGYNEAAGQNGEIWKGTLADFVTQHNSYTNGIAFDAPKEIKGRSGGFRFTYTVLSPPPGAPDVQAMTTGVDFVLEAQSK